MKILFFGTPDIAAQTLDFMIKNGCNICGAVSQPDKPKGRKFIIEETPVKKVAKAAGIPVFQPETIKGGELLPTLEMLKPDIIVVIAYGKIFPKYILDFPKFGCVNIHASLLPKLRGAAPIQWAVINGERESGVTTMLMNEGMDTGDIIKKYRLAIEKGDTAGDLFQKIAEISGPAIIDTLEIINSGKAEYTKQDESAATYAPMLSKEIAKIDFSKSAEEIINLVRGMNPWPVAFTYIDGSRMKVFEAAATEPEDIGGVALLNGEAIGAKNGIICGVGKGGAVIFNEIAVEGGKRMRATDYLAGHPITRKIKLGIGES